MLSLVSFVTPPDKIRLSLLGWPVINELYSAGVVVVPSRSNCSTPRLSVQGADTILLRNYASGLRNGAPYVNYEHGVGWRALEMVYNNTGEINLS